MSSEDIDSSTHPETNSLESDEPAQPVVPPLRIRYVSEINSAEISDASGSSAPKRSWLASPSEADGSTKRTRVETEPDQGAANCSLPSDMDAAAHPSTSPGSRSPKRNAATSDGHEEKDTAAGSSSAPVAGQGGEVVVKQEVVVKEEPKDETPSGSNDPVAAAAVLPVTVKKESSVKEEATSSIRDSCQFGIRCYRSYKNPTQLKLLIEFMENHKELRNFQRTDNRFNAMWEALKTLLNRYGPPTNSVVGWKKVWRDHNYDRSNKKRQRNRPQRNKHGNQPHTTNNANASRNPAANERKRKKMERRLVAKRTNALVAALGETYETIYLADDCDDCFIIPPEFAASDHGEVIEIECDDNEQEDFYIDTDGAADATADADAAAGDNAAAADASAATTANDVFDAATEIPTAERINAKVEYQKRMIEIFAERNYIEKTKVEMLIAAEQEKTQYRKRKMELREREIQVLEERNRLEWRKMARTDSSA